MFFEFLVQGVASTAQASEASYDIAKRIATRAKNAIDEGSWGYYKNFGTWNYEGAMVYRGLWEIQSALKDQADFDIEPFLHDRLNFYQVRGFFLFFSEILKIFISTLAK